MLIQGSVLTDRTELLIKKYCELLDSGIPASEVLVLLQNSYKRELFYNAVKKNLKINHFENPRIYTFNGLCYNAIQNTWPMIENTIKTGSEAVNPHLTGLEISQFFFKHAIKEAGFKDYNSKINLLHQLFRRNSLIVNNNLSEEDVQTRSKILNEVFDGDAKTAIDIFKKKTIEYRSFDYIRQVSIFKYIYEKFDCFKDIKYLILDDADEITPAEFEFVKHLKSRLKSVYIGYDRYGSSRLGYLNTDIKTVERLEAFFKDEEVKNLDETPAYKKPSELLTFTRRLEMIEKALEKVQDLIASGINAGDICIVAPNVDNSLKFSIKEKFTPKEISYQFFSGSEKLCSDKTVKNVLSLLKLSLDEKEDIYTVRPLLNEMLNIPLKNCMKIVENYKNNGFFSYCNLENETYNIRLQKLIETIEKIKDKNLLLSEKIFIIYKNLILPQNEKHTNFEKLNFLLKQITDFEEVFERLAKNRTFQRSVITQIENSIISENPSSAPDIKENAVIIATAQKIIDYAIKTKYQIWLDTSSGQWIKDDFGTLYNAWVFQNSWEKESFTYEDNIELSKFKTEKMLRKLSLLAEDSIAAFSSIYDEQGNENQDGLNKFIIDDTQISSNKKDFAFSFTPREDQKPVLEYNSGKMAITAVPGAGKTTILLALIIKLLEKGIKSENIFVVTYMESAARNFKERIKAACPSLEKLPNISTIHGMALRILKENSNFVKASLDENFEVCDDTQRQKFMREILAKLQFNQEEYDKYQSAVTSMKLSGSDKIAYTKDKELQKFIKFYHTYNLYLKNRNMIDYDDMLLYSVQILKSNPDIAQYYQDMCKFVIEDEAQDSSVIQQQLLNILSKKHKNLIRCGDINQAITTTFTNTDLDGFKDFVQKSKNVTMDHSQRCAKDIFSLANDLVTMSQTDPDYQKAFFDIKMKEVQGKNPQNTGALKSRLFENYTEERSYILEQIRNIFYAQPDASIALLVRNNYQIEDYSSFFSNYGYNVVTRSDVLNRQPVFSLIFSLLKFCTYPWRNETVLEAAKVLKEQKLSVFSQTDTDFLNNLKTPFILLNQDTLNSDNLSRLYWDLNYWLENSSLDMEEFAQKAGNYYYNSEIEKSNVYMCAQLFKTFQTQYPDREIMIEKIKQAANKPAGAKFKFFTEPEKEEKQSGGSIQIMTFHKSKGDEFDYVFIPEFSEDILHLDKNKIKIKSKERFQEAVKGLNLNYKKKDEGEQKIFLLEENLRLIYVAITRARKKLFITCAKKYKKNAKTQPSLLFEKLTKLSGAVNVK